MVLFEVQQARVRLGQWLVCFQFDTDIAINGVVRVALRNAPVECEIKEQHNVAIHVHVVCYMKSLVQNKLCRTKQVSPTAHNRSIFGIHV